MITMAVFFTGENGLVYYTSAGNQDSITWHHTTCWWDDNYIARYQPNGVNVFVNWK